MNTRILILLVGFSTNIALTNDTDYYKETYENINTIKVESVSGNLNLIRSPNDKVHINMEADYTPAHNFKYFIEPDNGVLEIRELFIANTSGSSTWSIEIPDQIELSFISASGSLSIKDLEINVQSIMASGDIKITKCSGEFNISTASGDIEAIGVSITNKSIFNSASGDVEVVLRDEVRGDLTISSISGDAMLDYNDNPVTGTIKIETREDKGNIDCDIPLDSQHTILKVARNSQDTEEIGKEKSFLAKTIKTSSVYPLVLISTEVGTAKLKK